MESSDVTDEPKSSDSKPSGGRLDRRNQLLLATIPVLGAIAVALIYVKPWSFVNPCSVNITITSPSDGQVVANGNKGVNVIGKACSMTGRTGWLFDYDPNDGYYYLDYQTSSPTPVAVNNGGWAFSDQPIGNSGDQHVTYGITAVLANATCTHQLQTLKPDSNGDFRLKTFPSGCQVDDTVQVFVTWPTS